MVTEQAWDTMTKADMHVKQQDELSDHKSQLSSKAAALTTVRPVRTVFFTARMTVPADLASSPAGIVPCHEDVKGRKGVPWEGSSIHRQRQGSC